MIVPAVLFALLLGAFVFGILPRAGLARRVVATAVFIASIVLVYGGGIELMGRPKPFRLEWRAAAAQAQVLGAVPVENQAIYVWLSLPGAGEPRAYVLPWSVQAAQQLQDAMGEAQAKGTEVRMAMPVESGLDDRAPKFYTMPQPALPPKDYQSAAPILYQPPAGAS
jgi:hypothetical protein